VRIIREVASYDFGKNDTEGENVSREITLVDQGGSRETYVHLYRKGETMGPFLVAGSNAGKSKNCDLEATRPFAVTSRFSPSKSQWMYLQA